MAAATIVTTNGSSRNTQEQEIEESRNANAVLYKFKGELAIWRPEYLKDCTSNGLTMQRDTDIAGGFAGTKVLAYYLQKSKADFAVLQATIWGTCLST